MEDFAKKLKEAERLAARSSVSRRDFMQLAMMTGISVAAAGAMFSKAEAAETPKKGGTFRMGMEGGSATDSLDPRTYADSVMIAESLAVYNGMIEYDNAGNPTGELLESW
jgi:peptide/nickel transport system substrate-binding protein